VNQSAKFRARLSRWLIPKPDRPVIEPNFPAGTRLQVQQTLAAECLVDADNPVAPNRVDTVPDARAFLCFPVEYKDWEPKLVRHADRFSGGYSGYRLLVGKQAIGTILSVAKTYD
jgi:hypothetical protein